MEQQRAVNFLWGASNILPPSTQAHKLLKSHFLNNARLLIDTTISAEIPQLGFKSMCTKCSSRWCDGNFSVKYIPSSVRGSRAHRLVEALNKNETLTKKQKTRAKWFRKKINSSIVLTCGLCSHRTSLNLEKLDKKKVQELHPKKIEPINIVKKKKKDKTAGLKIEKHSSNVIVKVEKQQLIKKHQFPPYKKLESTKANCNKPQISSLPTQSMKSTKSKSKGNAKLQNKNLSKTHQKNTLLQLANLLKGSSKSQGSNDRLKNLLR